MPSKKKKTNEIIPISVVIPTYNRTKVLFDTIESLNSGEKIPEEIIVVDQTNPPVQFPETLKDAMGERLVVIHEEIPSSTRSRNIGLRRAGKDIVLFCDDDILVNDDSLKILYETMSREDVALAAGIHKRDNLLYEGKKSSLVRSVGGTLFGTQKLWRKDGYVVHGSMRGRYAPEITTITPTEWAMGYFFCIRKSLCEKYEIYFDEKLRRYAYAEDLDFSLRYCAKAKKENKKSLLVPQIYINHLASKEWRTPSYEKTLYTIANRRYLSYKIYPGQFWKRWFLSWSDWCYEKFICSDLTEKQNWHKVRRFCRQEDKHLKEGCMEEIYS